MKLLVTDYDNTLELHYDFTDNISILNRNKKALEIFIKNNILCIATGRHFNAMYDTLLKNDIKFSYLCTNNGAELYDNEYKLLFCIPLDKSDLEILNNVEYDVYLRKPFNSDVITSANFYIYDKKEYKKMEKFLKSNLNESIIEFKYPKIKIINKKCNKTNAVEYIKQNRKINDNDIYTIGDDVNDIPMIKSYNGYSIETACEDVKNVALYVYKELNQLVKDIQ